MKTARDRPVGDDTFLGNSVEAPVKTFFLAPTNIVNHRAAECVVPVTEQPHSISVENAQREREVEIGREVRRDNSREVPKKFCRSSRLSPYPAARPVELVIVLIEMNEGVDEKIFVAAFHPPIVNCSRLGVRDKLARNFFRGRRTKRDSPFRKAHALRHERIPNVSAVCANFFDAIIIPADLKNRNGEILTLDKAEVSRIMNRKKNIPRALQEHVRDKKVINGLENYFETNIVAELVPDTSDLIHQLLNVIRGCW